MKKPEIVQNYQSVTQGQKVSKCCWENCTNRPTRCRVFQLCFRDTNFQLGKKKKTKVHYLQAQCELHLYYRNLIKPK